MINFANYIDLPLVWSAIIATAILLYVLLDGFDLGVGILFYFAPSDKCRDKMMSSIAPFWDGNETWLVLGGGGLLAAFPLAYSILMPAFYVPIILMLLGLIFRGVAFEFRFKSVEKKRAIWDYSFHFGSLFATFMQGMILGNFVDGIEISNDSFAGGAFDWITEFSMMTGIALVFGYALLGATWLIMKTENETQAWAAKAAKYSSIFVGLFMVIVSISMPFLKPAVMKLWFSLPNFFYLLPIPLVTLGLFIMLLRDLDNYKIHQRRPFFFAYGLFLAGYFGLAISIWPWIVPYKVNIWDASAAEESQSLMLVAVSILLPIILIYTAFSYYIFRGKTSEHEIHY